MSAPPVLVYSEEASVYQELASLLPPGITALHLATVEALQQALQGHESTLLVLNITGRNETAVVAAVREHVDGVSLVLMTTPSTPTSLIKFSWRAPPGPFVTLQAGAETLAGPGARPKACFAETS